VLFFKIIKSCHENEHQISSRLMKPVVMISYYFPPDSSAGAYRPLRFVRHLPSFGWRPVVITNDPYHCLRYDPELLKQVPPTTEIVRVRNPDPWAKFRLHRERKGDEKTAGGTADARKDIQVGQQHPLRRVIRKTVIWLESVAYHPDKEMGWIKRATRATVDAAKNSGAKIIWATGGPWSSFVVARNAWCSTGIPYILDFRDSWTLIDDSEVRSTDWSIARQRNLLAGLFRDAQGIVFRYMSEAEAYWRAYPGVLDPRRIHIIPNGYEGSIAPFEVPEGARCTVLYTGSLGYYWYDNVIKALKLLKDSHPEVAKRLRVVFVGEGNYAVADMAAQLDLSDVIETKRPVSFSDTQQLQKESHALLLLGWKRFRGHELGGSKIFAYFKAGRPIIGTLPQDENSRMLRAAGVQTIADIESVEEIAKVFIHVVEAWSTGQLPSLLPDPVSCEKYSAENQTRALARALEGLTAEEPFVPGVNFPPPTLQQTIGEGGWVPNKGATVQTTIGTLEDDAMAEPKKETFR
jgi:glycosyltransferase involved in cell wall biosynthesis